MLHEPSPEKVRENKHHCTPHPFQKKNNPTDRVHACINLKIEPVNKVQNYHTSCVLLIHYKKTYPHPFFSPSLLVLVFVLYSRSYSCDSLYGSYHGVQLLCYVLQGFDGGEFKRSIGGKKTRRE